MLTCVLHPVWQAAERYGTFVRPGAVYPVTKSSGLDRFVRFVKRFCGRGGVFFIPPARACADCCCATCNGYLLVSQPQAALKWINMLLEKSPSDMGRFIQELLPSLLNALTDSADDVVLMNLQVSKRNVNVNVNVNVDTRIRKILWARSPPM